MKTYTRIPQIPYLRILTALLLTVLYLTTMGCATTPQKNESALSDADNPTAPNPNALAVVEQSKEAVHNAPNDPEAYFHLGNAWFDAQNMPEAITAYQKAIALKSGHASAHSNLGLCLKRQGHINEAIHEYRAALEIEPNDETTLKNLVVAQEIQKDHAGAVETLKKLAVLKPNDIQISAELADLLFELKHYDEAAEIYEKLLHDDPTLSDQYYNLGLCYLCRDRLDEALMTWLTALAHDPRNPSVNKGLAVLYWKRGDFDQAWDAVSQCKTIGIELDPEFLNALERDSRKNTKHP